MHLSILFMTIVAPSVMTIREVEIDSVGSSLRLWKKHSTVNLAREYVCDMSHMVGTCECLI